MDNSISVTTPFVSSRELIRSVAPLSELRKDSADLRLNDLAVGRDAAKSHALSAFRSRSGRNQPSSAALYLGAAVWLRALIKPPPARRRLSLLEAAGVRHRRRIVRRRRNASRLPLGDPYLAFARQAQACRPTPPRRRTALNASCSSNVFWAFNTGGSPQPRPANWQPTYCRARSPALITRPIPPSGSGQMRR